MKKSNTNPPITAQSLTVFGTPLHELKTTVQEVGYAPPGYVKLPKGVHQCCRCGVVFMKKHSCPLISWSFANLI